MKILSSTQKNKIINKLNNLYGITKLPYLLLQFGKEKLRLYSGNLSKQELIILDKNLRIETIGLYFANQLEDIRLTLDGSQLLKNQINKNILNIDDKRADEWLKGNDLFIETGQGFKILKNNNDFLGSGKSTGSKIKNFVPKQRRIKS